MALSVDSSPSTPAPAPAPVAAPAAPAQQPDQPKSASAQPAQGYSSESTFETPRAAPVALNTPNTDPLQRSGAGVTASPSENMIAADASEGGDNLPTTDPRVQADYNVIKAYPQDEQWAVAASAFSRYQEQANAGDPDAKARAAALVQVMKNDDSGMLDRVVADGFKRDRSGNPLRPLDDQNAITFGLRAAYDNGVLTDDDLTANASKPGWTDATASLKGAALDDVFAAQGRVNELQDKVAQADQQLAGELANFGPALTDDQRAKYTQAFRADHPEYGQLEQASKDLGALLEAKHLELANLATTDPVAADKLFTALEAGSKAAGSAPGVVTVISDLYKIAQSGRVQGKDYSVLLKDALPLAAAAFSGTSADTQAAFQKFSNIVKPILDVDGKARGVQSAWDALSDSANGNYDRLKTLQDGFENDSDFARGLKVAAIVFGAKSGVESAQNGDYLKAVNQLASAGKGGLELMAGATEALSDSSRFFAAAEKVAFPQIAERLIPYLGLVASATSLGLDIRDASQGVDPGKIAKIVGDTISVTGAFLDTIPGGELPGTFISAVGGLVTAGGAVVSGFFQQSDLEKARRKHLAGAGITGQLQDILVNTTSGRARELSQELGISAPDIQALAQKYPDLLDTGENQGLSLAAFKQLASAFNLTGTEATGLLNQIGVCSSDPDYSLYVVLNTLMQATGGEPRSTEEYMDILRNASQQPAHDPDYNVGFTNALSFLDNLEISRFGT